MRASNRVSGHARISRMRYPAPKPVTSGTGRRIPETSVIDAGTLQTHRFRRPAVDGLGFESPSEHFLQDIQYPLSGTSIDAAKFLDESRLVDRPTLVEHDLA